MDDIDLEKAIPPPSFLGVEESERQPSSPNVASRFTLDDRVSYPDSGRPRQFPVPASGSTPERSSSLHLQPLPQLGQGHSSPRPTLQVPSIDLPPSHTHHIHINVPRGNTPSPASRSTASQQSHTSAASSKANQLEIENCERVIQLPWHTHNPFRPSHGNHLPNEMTYDNIIIPFGDRPHDTETATPADSVKTPSVKSLRSRRAASLQSWRSRARRRVSLSTLGSSGAENGGASESGPVSPQSSAFNSLLLHPDSESSSYTLFPNPRHPNSVSISLPNNISLSKVSLYAPQRLLDISSQFYLYCLLGLPMVYFSRVTRIFDEANLTLDEIKVLVCQNGVAEREKLYVIHKTVDHSIVPPAYTNLKFSWEYFVDCLIKEWKTLNIVSALLLGAILTILQIPGASDDPFMKHTALFSLICALVSLLYGCMYIIRFSTIRRTYMAAEWALEAKKLQNTYWNIWILLALPAVWLTWSLILFVACVMSYVWRSFPSDSVGAMSLSPSWERFAFTSRIIISSAIGIALIDGILVILVFSRWGHHIEDKWMARIDQFFVDSEDLSDRDLSPLAFSTHSSSAAGTHHHPAPASQDNREEYGTMYPHDVISQGPDRDPVLFPLKGAYDDSPSSDVPLSPYSEPFSPWIHSNIPPSPIIPPSSHAPSITAPSPLDSAPAIPYDIIPANLSEPEDSLRLHIQQPTGLDLSDETPIARNDELFRTPRISEYSQIRHHPVKPLKSALKNSGPRKAVRFAYRDNALPGDPTPLEQGSEGSDKPPLRTPDRRYSLEPWGHGARVDVQIQTHHDDPPEGNSNAPSAEVARISNPGIFSTVDTHEEPDNPLVPNIMPSDITIAENSASNLKANPTADPPHDETDPG